MAGLSRRGVLAAAGLAILAAAPSGAAPRPEDMVLGSPKAPVEVVEYASLTCSHCAAFHADVFPAFKAKYVDTGKVRYILRELPTAPVDVAVAGFLMARCAGPTKYFKVVGEVFASQSRWYADGGAPLPVLMGIGKANGLSQQRVEACIRDPAAAKALNARVRHAVEEAGVRATPTFFVNGKLVSEGEMSLAELDAAIAAATPGRRR